MFWVIKRKTIIFFLIGIIMTIALVVALLYHPVASVYFGYANRQVPIYKVETEKKQVALTFDAAYGSDKTLDIIKILKDYQADATFFLVGFWVENFPDVAKAIADEGFEIGTHSNTHPHFNRLTSTQMDDELAKSVAIIKETTGFTPTTFRAPYGEYNDKLLTSAKKQNLHTIQWNVDSLDWKKLSAEEIATRVLKKTTSGSIILMHNNSDFVLNFLPVILSSLKEQGYEFVKVSNLIYHDNYTIDSQGTQKPLAV